MQADSIKPDSADEQYQIRILSGVSRTFALTIPQLPAELSRVVGNAYLLCRIADTIEDDEDLPLPLKRDFSEQFINVVTGLAAADQFADKLLPLLSENTSEKEKDLITNTPAIIRITHSLNTRQRAALERCIRTMAEGMVRYQGCDIRAGLKDQLDMDNYCYHVAGVVGELLTELFCNYSAEIDQHHAVLMPLSVSFGQGLQMTNILKDIWDDRSRNMCWLPRDVFAQYGADLGQLSVDNNSKEFRQGLGYLIGVTHAHLHNALGYTLLIPAHETGIRRFCLWALGMAVLTLRNINRHRDFTTGQQVKISRSSVRNTVRITNLLTKQDRLLKLLFKLYTRTLPITGLPDNLRAGSH
jgi:farnesyl-diphosphate farnesyltransferase